MNKEKKQVEARVKHEKFPTIKRGILPHYKKDRYLIKLDIFNYTVLNYTKNLVITELRCYIN